MAIPKIRELYNPILDFLYQYGETSLADIRYAMAKSFFVPDWEAFNFDGDAPTLFMGRVNNACFNLYYAGLIIRVRRGVYDISKKGRKAVDDEDFVDSDYLWQFPSYIEYIMRRYEVARSKDPEKPIPLPTPNPDIEDVDIVQLDKHFRPMELLTMDDMVKLRDQDARFANMIATGEYLYDDGIIKQVPREVLQHDMSYQEFKATTLMHSAGQAIMCYQEVSTGQMVTAPQPTIEGYHKTKKGTRPWSNPYPPTPGAGSGGGKGTGAGKGPGNGGGGGSTGGYNGNRNSDMVQEMLDFIQQSHGDFNKCFTHLMDVYGITEVMLEQKSGINKKQIQRYRNDPKFQASVEELTAIMLVLQASSYILEAFISLIGQDPKSDKWKPYCIICDIMKYATYEEVNAQCRKYNRVEIFPQNLSGPIS